MGTALIKSSLIFDYARMEIINHRFTPIRYAGFYHVLMSHNSATINFRKRVTTAQNHILIS
jgi:hypothetical protein